MCRNLPNARITFDKFHVVAHANTAVHKTRRIEPRGDKSLKGRQTYRFIEALNGLFQAAKRRARGYNRMSTIRTVLILTAGKLDFRSLNLFAAKPT